MRTFKWCPQEVAYACENYETKHYHISIRSPGADDPNRGFSMDT